jgi:hypothetical protein
MEHGSGIDLTNHLHHLLRHHHQHRPLIPTTPNYLHCNVSTLLDVLLPALVMKAQGSQVSGGVQDLNISTTFRQTGRFFKPKNWLWIGANNS